MANRLKAAIFLHIQKTAGTSIVDIARNAYGNDQVSSHGDYLLPPKELDEIINAEGFNPPHFSEKLFISGHFGFNFARQLAQNRYFFTFLRNPIERILSYYYFCRSRDPKEYEIYSLAQSLPLDDFLMLGIERPAVKACIWNNQSWQLAAGYGCGNRRNITNYSESEILDLAISHLKDFSYVGFAETFEFDRNNILLALGIVPPTDKIVSNSNPGRPGAQNLAQPTLDLLAELTKIDWTLYNEAWNRRGEIAVPVDLRKPASFISRLKLLTLQKIK